MFMSRTIRLYEKCGFLTAQAIADELEFGKNHTVIQIPRNENPKSPKKVDFDCHEVAKGTLEGTRYGFMGVMGSGKQGTIMRTICRLLKSFETSILLPFAPNIYGRM